MILSGIASAQYRNSVELLVVCHRDCRDRGYLNYDRAVSTFVSRRSVSPPVRLVAGRDLLLNLVKAELTARYKTATFGVFWFLLNPALTAAVLVVIFQNVVHLSIEHYQMFLLAALLPWTFFQMGLSNAVTSLTRAPAMVKRVRIPRALLPLAAILACLVHFLLSLVLLVILLFVVGIPPTGRALLFLPVVIAIQTVGLMGLALAAASLNVLYRDVEHLVLVGLRLGFWLTPVFYPLAYVPARWRAVALLNPMTSLIEAYRALFVRRVLPNPGVLATAAVLAVLLLGIGIVLFVRIDPQMDDHV
jgi:ABC-type polysaccharide/polyol phosphate export permease